MTLEQSLIADIKELPDSLKKEAAHYVEFLKSRYNQVVSKPTSSNKEALKNAFEKLQKHQVFDNIENPTSWKKQLRNEWE